MGRKNRVLGLSLWNGKIAASESEPPGVHPRIPVASGLRGDSEQALGVLKHARGHEAAENTKSGARAEPLVR